MRRIRGRGIFEYGYNLSLEEDATGKEVIEDEKVFYAKLADKSILDKAASSENHEQWELRIGKTEKNACSGRIRVRKTTKADAEPEYVQTSKNKHPVRGEREVPNPSSEDAFNQFKLFAESGMIKKRFVFDIADRTVKWEVDTFLNKDGSLNEWCKIDLEITDGNYTIPPFPEGLFDLESVISAADKDQTSQETIRDLYGTIFITKNEFLTE